MDSQKRIFNVLNGCIYVYMVLGFLHCANKGCLHFELNCMDSFLFVTRNGILASKMNF